MVEKVKKSYQKPSVKSSKLKMVYYYGRGSLVNADQAEFLLAGYVS
jgi:hypothetical protein